MKEEVVSYTCYCRNAYLRFFGINPSCARGEEIWRMALEKYNATWCPMREEIEVVVESREIKWIKWTI